MNDPIAPLLTALLVAIGQKRHHLEDAIAAAVSLLVLPQSLRRVREDPAALQLLVLLLVISRGVIADNRARDGPAGYNGIGAHSSAGVGGAAVLRDIRRLYLYAVCFVALLLMVYAAVHLSGLVVDVLVPTPLPVAPRPVPMEGESPEAARERWEAERAQQAAYERHRRAVELARTLTTLAIASPLYLYHWRLARRTDPDRDS